MIQFTGKDIDLDTGLYYFNARWYDPSLGRFMTEDPIRDGLNWYVYANNNPLKFVDPTGLMNVYVDNVNGDPVVDYPGRDLKAETNVVETRDSSEGYYNDTMDVKIGDKIIESIPIQGEAAKDDPTDDNDGALSSGKYELTLLPETQSPSYENGMSISGNGVSIDDGYMIHPNVITNPQSDNYGTTYTLPVSTGCSVTNGTSDFIKIRDFLEAVDYGDWEIVDLDIVDIPVEKSLSFDEQDSGRYAYPF